MKICATSDIHSFLPKVPETELILICGDLCWTRKYDLQSQYKWAKEKFAPWVNKLSERMKVIYIAGNHDELWEKSPEVISTLGISREVSYLQDSGITYKGLNIWGTPWQPTFYNWSFNLSEEELAERFSLIPENTHILMSHGPPLGILDLVDNGSRRAGSYSLRERIKNLKHLRLGFFGHLHLCGGMEELVDGVLFANVAYVDEQYRPTIKNLKVFDIPAEGP